MKSLFWKQPYGSLMLFGKIETRTWQTSYRGPVLICTSKQQYDFATVNEISGDVQLYRLVPLLGLTVTTQLLGYAIAVGNLVDCRPMLKEDEDRTFVQYQPGLYCHEYNNIKTIRPFPYQGHLSFREVPEKIIEQIKYLQ